MHMDGVGWRAPPAREGLLELRVASDRREDVAWSLRRSCSCGSTETDRQGESGRGGICAWLERGALLLLSPAEGGLVYTQLHEGVPERPE